MPISDRIGGFIKPGYFPLKIPDAPTIGTASTSEAIGSNAISIAFTAPSNVGGGAITSYEAVATDTVTAATFTETGSSTPIVVTGLSAGQTYTVTVSATNAYGSSVASAASNSATAVVFPGTLWAWGDGNYGALGLGNTTDYSSPVQVGALTNWELMAVGGAYGSSPNSACVKTDGTLWTWGRNNDGCLGQGNLTQYSSPVQVGALTTWSKIANGAGRHMLAVKTDGTYWAWGRGYGGALGQGGLNESYSSPVQVGALTDWLDVSASYSLSLALKTDGTIWAMGSNNYGQLGDGTTDNKSSPVQIGALTTWSAISAGGWWAVALKTDGTIWGWGAGNDGCLAQGNTTSYSSPVQVGALTTWSAVAGGIPVMELTVIVWLLKPITLCGRGVLTMRGS